MNSLMKGLSLHGKGTHQYYKDSTGGPTVSVRVHVCWVISPLKVSRLYECIPCKGLQWPSLLIFISCVCEKASHGHHETNHFITIYNALHNFIISD